MRIRNSTLVLKSADIIKNIYLRVFSIIRKITKCDTLIFSLRIGTTLYEKNT